MRPEGVVTYVEWKQSNLIAKISQQLVIAAAEEDNNNRKDNYPSTVVIIKDVA